MPQLFNSLNITSLLCFALTWLLAISTNRSVLLGIGISIYPVALLSEMHCHVTVIMRIYIFPLAFSFWQRHPLLVDLVLRWTYELMIYYKTAPEPVPSFVVWDLYRSTPRSSPYVDETVRDWFDWHSEFMKGEHFVFVSFPNTLLVVVYSAYSAYSAYCFIWGPAVVLGLLRRVQCIASL